MSPLAIVLVLGALAAAAVGLWLALRGRPGGSVVSTHPGGRAFEGFGVNSSSGYNLYVHPYHSVPAHY